MLRKRYWGQPLWARGYFWATVGAVDEETIKAYIASQRWEEDGGEGFRIESPPSRLEPAFIAGSLSSGFQPHTDFQSSSNLPALAGSGLVKWVTNTSISCVASSKIALLAL